jgi:hypothetical protein
MDESNQQCTNSNVNRQESLSKKGVCNTNPNPKHENVASIREIRPSSVSLSAGIEGCHRSPEVVRSKMKENAERSDRTSVPDNDGIAYSRKAPRYVRYREMNKTGKTKTKTPFLPLLQFQSPSLTTTKERDPSIHPSIHRPTKTHPHA